MVKPALVIAVLGLGEAGSEIACDLLAAGAGVRGYDPAVAAGPGITGTRSEAEAARGADLVLSVNSAKAAVDAFRRGPRAVLLLVVRLLVVRLLVAWLLVAWLLEAWLLEAWLLEAWLGLGAVARAGRG